MAAVVSLTDLDRDTTLVSLMTRIQRADQGAFSRLYDLSIDRVYAIAFRVLGNAADAEEAVCDCYQQAWERSRQYSVERGSVMAWLSVICHTRALDLKRRRREHVRLEPLHPDETHEAYTEREDRTVADLLDLMTSGTAVHAALQGLGEQPRALIRMAFIDDLSHQEIAERTGLPLGTVKSHIRRGLQKVKESLGDLRHE